MAKRHIYDGQWYALSPPKMVGDKKFTEVWCVCQVPDHPDEYQVKGTPEGGEKEEPFILSFGDNKTGVINISSPRPK